MDTTQTSQPESEKTENAEVPATKKASASKAMVPIIIVIVLLGLATYGAYSVIHKKSGTQAQTSSVAYKDGTYSAEGSYITHVGPEKMIVKVTLKNNLITDSEITKEATDPVSVHYQSVFDAGYKPQVIGKDISTVHLSKISSSSLTPNGFNDALKKIEAQAKS